MTTILKAEIKEVTVRQDGDRVLLIAGGKLLFSLPWDAADVLARAIYTQARRAEEIAKAAQIIADQAILTRLGTPFGLTSHPVMLREAANEAAWGLPRRYIPLSRAGGIHSQAVFGTPTLKQDPPKE